MDQRIILIVGMTLGVIGWIIISKYWILSWLKKQNYNKALALLTIPHIFRYIGLTFLITGVTTTSLNTSFAHPAAYGDLLAAVLALLTTWLLLARKKFAWATVWLFNIIGFADFLVAVTQGLKWVHPSEMGATLFIPLLGVPFFFVSHLLIFWMLLERKRAETYSNSVIQ